MMWGLVAAGLLLVLAIGIEVAETIDQRRHPENYPPR